MKITVININLIDEIFDVRNRTYADHVETLLAALKSGIKLPPIKVFPIANDRFGILDGRHRLKANRLFGSKSMECEVHSDFGENGERQLRAFECNVGGARPPIPSDFIAICADLLEQGWTPKKISLRQPLMGPWIARASQKLREEKTVKALAEISSSALTVAAAAKEYGLDISYLKRRLIPAEEATAEELRKSLRQMVHDYNSLTNSLHRRILNAWRRGEITAKEAADLVSAERQEIQRFDKNAARQMRILAEETEAHKAQKQ